MKVIISLLVLIGFLFSAGALLAEEQVQPNPPAAEQAASAQPAPQAAAAPKLDSGDTAWMIVATALVVLMTIPGLALFYGGLAKRKDALNTMAMSFAAFCIVSVLWVLYGYTFAFGTDISGIIGSPEKLLLSGVTSSSLTGTIPEFIFIVFSSPCGNNCCARVVHIERIKFSAWILFCILWLTLHIVCTLGMGSVSLNWALDFAGGYSPYQCRCSSPVGAPMLGKRRDPSLMPNNRHS